MPVISGIKGFTRRFTDCDEFYRESRERIIHVIYTKISEESVEEAGDLSLNYERCKDVELKQHL